MNLIQSIYAVLSTITKRFIVWWNAEYDKRTGRSKWIFLAVSCLFACCICSVPMSLILPDPTPTRIVNDVAGAEAAEPTPEEETPFPTAESRASGIEVEATSTLVDTAEPIIVAAATAADPTNTPRSIRAATSDQAASATPAPTQPPPTKLSTPSPTVAPTIAPTSPPLPTATAAPPTLPSPTAISQSTAVLPTAAPPTAIPPTSPPPEPTQPPQPTAPPEPTAPLPVAGGPLIIIGVNKQAEYVDIQNTSAADVDLEGWILRSERGSQDCALHGVLGAGQVLRIWAMAEDAGQGGFNCGFGSNIWNNSESDPAVLIDPAGNEVSRR